MAAVAATDMPKAAPVLGLGDAAGETAAGEGDEAPGLAAGVSGTGVPLETGGVVGVTSAAAVVVTATT